MLLARTSEVHGRGLQSFHDQSVAAIRSIRPIAFQIDGEYVGERESVTFRSVPAALRVVALSGISHKERRTYLAINGELLANGKRLGSGPVPGGRPMPAM